MTVNYAKKAFISAIMIGDCPKCGSNNTHDCDAKDNTCLTAQQIDDICVGHCDDCDYTWCLECEMELYTTFPCKHWVICDECKGACNFENDISKCSTIKEWQVQEKIEKKSRERK